MMFYPLNPTNGSIVNRSSTANGYGHWFNQNGVVCAYGSGYVFSELSPSSMTFTVGQYPNRLKEGNTYKIGQALRYHDANGKEAIARFWFTVHVGEGKTGAELSSMEYDDPTGFKQVSCNKSHTSKGTYTVCGQRIKEPATNGLYIIDGQKKVVSR